MGNKDITIVSRLLAMAADVFSNHGCNDLPRDFLNGLNEAEKQELSERVCKWLDSEIENPSPQFLRDDLLMQYFADRFSRLPRPEDMIYGEINFSIEGDGPIFEVVVDKTKDLNKLRQDLCRKYDDLVDEVKRISQFGNRSREVRNLMDELRNIVYQIGALDGRADIKPLTENYTTLDRYIP